jgi:hypothetical protein
MTGFGVPDSATPGKPRRRIEAATAILVHDRIRHRDEDLGTCASATTEVPDGRLTILVVDSCADDRSGRQSDSATVIGSDDQSNPGVVEVLRPVGRVDCATSRSEWSAIDARYKYARLGRVH